MPRRFRLPVALVLASLALGAEPPPTDTPADYAFALPLQVSGRQGVVGFRLPLAVYQHAQKAGLEDLRVFDAQGVAQPHALHTPTQEAAAQHRALPATIFPIRTHPESGAAGLDLDIQTRPDGSVSAVQARTGKAASGTALTGLILDFGPGAKASATQTARVEALHFAPPKGQINYTAEVWLETSNDLKQWDTVGAAELSWLRSDTAQTLANDRLEFSPQAFRYARLTWRRGEALPFGAIEADLVTRRAAEPPRETLWIAPTAGRQGNDLVYPAGLAIPADQVVLRFSEPNIVFPVALGHYVERPSRHTGKPTEWVFQPQASATFYQITQNDQTRRSAALNLGGGHGQEWVLRPQNPGATARPELGLSWQAATLVFLAGGTPPYTLSFGRDGARSTALPLQEVAPNFSLEELGRLELATAGPLQAHHLEHQAESAAALAAGAARTRALILWGVLVLGVLVLGGMAWKLYAQMKADPQP